MHAFAAGNAVKGAIIDCPKPVKIILTGEALFHIGQTNSDLHVDDS
jgi:hypothetical protein